MCNSRVSTGKTDRNFFSCNADETVSEPTQTSGDERIEAISGDCRKQSHAQIYRAF